MKRKFFIVFLFFLLGVATFYFLSLRTIDTLPDKSKVENMSIQIAEKEVRTKDSKMIEEILYDMKSARKTMKSSNNDQPLVQPYITLIFKNFDGNSDTFYFYEMKGKYYIEKPYAGIYKSDQNVEENIQSYFNFLNSH